MVLTSDEPFHDAFLRQDFLTCAFLVTAKDSFFGRSEMCLLASYMADAVSGGVTAHACSVGNSNHACLLLGAQQSYIVRL
jgi:hypothetical protein